MATKAVLCKKCFQTERAELLSATEGFLFLVESAKCYERNDRSCHEDGNMSPEYVGGAQPRESMSSKTPSVTEISIPRCAECRSVFSAGSVWTKSRVSEDKLCTKCRGRENVRVVRSETEDLVCPICWATESSLWLKSIATEFKLCKVCYLRERTELHSGSDGLFSLMESNDFKDRNEEICDENQNLAPESDGGTHANDSPREEETEKYTMDEGVDLLFFLRYGTDQNAETAPTDGEDIDMK